MRDYNGSNTINIVRFKYIIVRLKLQIFSIHILKYDKLYFKIENINIDTCANINK